MEIAMKQGGGSPGPRRRPGLGCCGQPQSRPGAWLRDRGPAHVLGLAAILWLLTPFVLRAEDDPGAALSQDLKKLVDVFAAVESEAADPVDAGQAIYQGAIPAALRTLDPHSIFFDPDQFQQLQQMQKSEAKGFGTIVSIVPGRVIVLQTMQGSPSAKAGLGPGDEILAINGLALSQLEPEQLVQLLSQARQQAVVLDVRRPGNARIFRMGLTPELIDTPSIDRVFLIAPAIGYLRIKSFEEATGKLTKETIEKLGGANLKGLVIDLRDNPGGAVQAAVDTASLFLKPDQLIFSIKGRSRDDPGKDAEPQEARVPKLADPYTFPVAILVDAKTASASEILSGALQDHDRATILGEPSYGKGLVQNVFPMMGNTGLALTIAFYYTPSGRSIQKPLASGSLDIRAKATPGEFHTDAGRVVEGGGGIIPDTLAGPAPSSQLMIVLDATGSLTSFAGEYVQSHEVTGSFEVTPAILDQLQVFLSARNIRPGVSDWLRDREMIQSKLKQEIVNLKFGVAKGDEIEVARDPVVKRALEAIGKR
jgi:carboxyl-terminal processing protease